ncbi:anti-sigma regulatory factor [Salipaludibacillus agaradhaerens]|uniref:anti-sigma regulatory factor n=1 Tax=Salipaludibacillus agaradhaerens TaxID=76935 RepID=UPI002151C675|nr:anti-sigma regulatory factor [Salipaludibacillus agaradhaerens]MCR6105350.1 anti-sigma regulatory factor [Salipaludibacillus agaradhaerens]MCR6117391.1 anti-sigma regulatory factor [Salipaludibacillus agaradhaerens]UJW56583.1 anti-sigma regulatory factor [Bacillus sp. A116_S68]
MQVQTHVDIHSEWGIVAARQAGRKLAREIGFGSVDQARITTAISELARNIYLYANRGQIQIEEVTSSENRGIKIVAVDEGPGIKDLRRVMEDGFTTSGGLGAGLPGVKRLMDTFDIESEVNEGTTITAIKWLR